MPGQPLWQGDIGRNWARLREATDRQLAEVGDATLGLLDARPGERILDLGCGGGSTTLALAEAVGPTGRVTGIDISPDLALHARQRADAFPHVTIVEADATDHPFQPAAHDALFSRVGCMFFENASAAFANIRRGLRPGARVAMSALAPLSENPWATVPMKAAESVLGPAQADAQAPPGPFAWADPTVFETALAAAGFRSIAWEGRTVTFRLGAGDDPDPVERACEMVSSIGIVARRVMAEGHGAEARVRPALREALAPHVRNGCVHLPARIWLITATA